MSTNPHTKLTLQEVIEAEDLDLLLSLHGVGRAVFWHARSRPEHLTLAKADGVDVLLTDLQDQAAVHHVQQGLGVKSLFLVLHL